MNFDIFSGKLLRAAALAGIDQAEIYAGQADSFRAGALDGDISDYAVSSSMGLSLRGVVDGSMGYASSEVLDEASITLLIDGVKESALLCKGTESADIFPGSDAYGDAPAYSEQLDHVSTEDKIALALALEKAISAVDPRIRADRAMVSTQSVSTQIRNTFGLSLDHKLNIIVAMVSCLAREGDAAGSGYDVFVGRDFSAIDPAKMAAVASRQALDQLTAKSAPSGQYDIVFGNEAMSDLLSTFSGLFSAENAQQGLSLLKGRVGETIASPLVTLADNPHLKDGLATCPFDDEGVATYDKNVIENGILRTLLHNRKTAKKDSVRSTGNAAKSSYASTVRVAPSNFYIVPSTDSEQDLFARMGNGINITAVSGLHAGANPVSGDFSLLCNGYMVADGKKGRAVQQITVAGNFLSLLASVRGVASDLLFPGSGIGSPSVWVENLSIAGK